MKYKDYDITITKLENVESPRVNADTDFFAAQKIYNPNKLEYTNDEDLEKDYYISKVFIYTDENGIHLTRHERGEFFGVLGYPRTGYLKNEKRIKRILHDELYKLNYFFRGEIYKLVISKDDESYEISPYYGMNNLIDEAKQIIDELTA